MIEHEYLNKIADLSDKMLLAVSKTGEMLVSDNLAERMGIRLDEPSADKEAVRMMTASLKTLCPDLEDHLSQSLDAMLKKTFKTILKTLSGEVEVEVRADRHSDGTLLISICERNEFMRYKEHAERLHELKDRLMHLSSAMMAIEDQQELLELILDTAISSLEQASVGTILLMESQLPKRSEEGKEKKETLSIIASRGYKPEDARQFHLLLEDSFYFKASGGSIGDVIIVKDLSVLSPHAPLIPMENGETIRSVISAPLIVNGALYGFMNLDGCGVGEFTEADKEIFTYLKQQVEEVLCRYKLYNQILYLSRYDKLTDVLNRSYFEEAYTDYVKKHVDADNGFTVVIFDVDGLKTVNDNFGHQAGDKLIKTFTDKMKEVFEGEELFARLGGDEFILVTDRLTRSDVLGKLSGVVDYFSKTMIEYNSLYYACDFSYGISSFPNDSSDRSVLMKLADERMYDSKSRRKLR